MNEQNSTHESASARDIEPRRGFFASFLSVVIGGAITLVPIVTGVIFFFDPVVRKKKSAAGGETGTGSPGEGYLRVTSESAIPDDGTPVFQEIRRDVVDAWNTYLDQPVGSVYLRKTEDGTISCFSTECPHLGCAVSYVESGDDPGYYCPCHASSFKLNGKRKNETPPRPLDSLDVQVSDDGDVWVKFQSFKIGVAEKIPKA